MNNLQGNNLQEPKTPIKPKSNLIADQIQFIYSDQKPKQFSLVDQILEDQPDHHMGLFSSNKQSQDPSYQDSYSYYSPSASNNQSEQSELQSQKYQTVKKLFEPKFPLQQTKLPLTARTNTKGCNCDKSKCLKNYCVCHKMGNICSSDCECIDCENNVITEEHLKNEKVALELLSNVKNKGCNCKNSGCLKNYCVCHQYGKKCTQACRCQNCMNMDDKEKDMDNEQKGMRLMFTARKKIKISEFEYEDNKQNMNINI